MLLTIIVISSLLVLAYCLVKSIGDVKKLKSRLSELQNVNERLSGKVELLTRTERISHLGSWELLVESNFIKWSDELYNIYGFKDRPELNASINQEIIAPEYRDKVMKELNAAIINKTSFAVEYQIVQPSGIRKYVLGQGFYIEKEAKLVGTIQDITELKEAVLKLKINESLLREAEIVSHNGSWEWLENKEFILWSDEMYNVHGYLPHSVFVDFAFYRHLVHKDDLPRLINDFNRARKNKSSFKINYRIIRPSGEVRHVLSTAEYKRIGLNEDYAYIGNTQDVTELREAQVQLEEKMTELNRSNQDLEQFAYVASHDLQEPLRKIQSFGDRLKSKFSLQLDAEGLDYLERMRNAAERMRKLINDLLAFSKTTREHRKFVRVNLQHIIENTVKELDLTIENKKAKINVAADQEVDGIESQLAQLFHNLLGNSLKFTASDEPPEIEITASNKYGYELPQEEANQNLLYCVIEIKDNGIGFEEKNAAKIFDIFYRLNSRNEYEGTGIGLAICKKIADNHSGFISAKSEFGRGAIFKIGLPKKQAK